jgi:hypothetical protein
MPCLASAPKPATPGPGARQDQRTAAPPPATTWENGEEETHPQGTA